MKIYYIKGEVTSEVMILLLKRRRYFDNVNSITIVNLPFILELRMLWIFKI